jgi:hypothetical protein
MKNGQEEYKEAFEELKGNKSYYKYFKKIENYINESNCSLQDVDEKLILAALNSLNIDLYKVPFIEMSNIKDFQNLISLEKNNLRFNPNTRFKIFLKKELGIIDDSDPNINIAYETTYSDSNENIAQMCRCAINSIYSDSCNLDIIKERVKSISTSIIHIGSNIEQSELFSAFPISLNTKVDYKIDISTLDSVLGNRLTNKEAAIKFNHLLGAVEQMSLVSLWPFYEDEEKVAYYDLNDIIDIINNTNKPIIFSQFKLYKKVKDQLSIYKEKRIIYIVRENAVAYSIQFIREEFDSGKWTVINGPLYKILVVHKENIVLVQLIAKELNYKDFEDIFSSAKIENKSKDEFECDIKVIRKIAQKVFISCSYAQQNKAFGFSG